MVTPKTDSEAEERSGPPRTGPSEPPADSVRKAMRGLTARNSTLWTFGVLVILVIAFALVTDNFFSKQGWTVTSIAATELLLLAIGETYVIVAGGVDLSIGAVLGFAGMSSAWIMQHLLSSSLGAYPVILTGFLVALVAGAIFGAFNALAITRFSLTPLIVTLGTLGIAQGATQLLNKGQEISDLPPELSTLGNKLLAGNWIAAPVALTAIVAIVAWVVLSKTRFGRRTHAIGSNTQAALRTGINVRGHLTIIYIFSGALAGLAGFVATAQLGVATVSAGTGSELQAIVAVIIGGASLYGGRGSIAGTVIGALIVAVLATGLIVAKVNSAWQLIAVGLILIGALLVDRQRVRAASAG